MQCPFVFSSAVFWGFLLHSLLATFFLTSLKKVQVIWVPKGDEGGWSTMWKRHTHLEESSKPVLKVKAFLYRRYRMLEHFCRYVWNMNPILWKASLVLSPWLAFNSFAYQVALHVCNLWPSVDWTMLVPRRLTSNSNCVCRLFTCSSGTRKFLPSRVYKRMSWWLKQLSSVIFLF